MDVSQLRSAVALAEEASFSRAAARLGVAQPSLSQQIKKLENSVGRRLFDRLPKRVVPTQAGQRLVAHARVILAQVADAERQLAEDAGCASGPLSVGVIPTIAPFLLPKLMTAMAKRFPRVEPRVVEDVTDRLVEQVERGDLDVAILSSHPGSRTIHVEPVGEEPLLLMLPRSHRLAKRSSVTWPQLAGERFLALHEMHCLSGQVAHLCERQNVRTPVVMRGAQLATIAGMVGAGLGVSIVPRMMRPARGGAAGDCVFVPFKDDAPSRVLSVCWSLLRYRTNASRSLVDVLRDVLATRVSVAAGRALNHEGTKGTKR